MAELTQALNAELSTLLDAIGLPEGMPRQVITSCIEEQIQLANAELPPGMHRWRLPGDVTDSSDWFTGVDITPVATVDGFIRVITTATTSLHPQAVMEV